MAIDTSMITGPLNFIRGAFGAAVGSILSWWFFFYVMSPKITFDKSILSRRKLNDDGSESDNTEYLIGFKNTTRNWAIFIKHALCDVKVMVRIKWLDPRQVNSGKRRWVISDVPVSEDGEISQYIPKIKSVRKNFMSVGKTMRRQVPIYPAAIKKLESKLPANLVPKLNQGSLDLINLMALEEAELSAYVIGFDYYTGKRKVFEQSYRLSSDGKSIMKT